MLWRGGSCVIHEPKRPMPDSPGQRKLSSKSWAKYLESYIMALAVADDLSSCHERVKVDLYVPGSVKRLIAWLIVNNT